MKICQYYITFAKLINQFIEKDRTYSLCSFLNFVRIIHHFDMPCKILQDQIDQIRPVLSYCQSSNTYSQANLNFYYTITYKRILAMSKKFIVIFLILLILASLAQTKKKVNKPTKQSKKNHKSKQSQPHYLTPNQPQYWLNVLLATFLSLAGGFCSGMTVGLNSLSLLNLQVMLKSQDKQTKKMAERILGVISDHHLFLVTLLVGNAIVLQSLPLVIHLIMPDWAAILFSTVIVLVVAEVVPMSLSTGSNKYIIAYYGTPLVAIMIKIFYPICYPIARGLDKILGKQHQERILRRDFLTFINDKKKNFLQQLQIQFINQIMNHKNKTVKQIMIPQETAFALQENELITEKIIKEISQKQYTYIPVYRKDPKCIIGYVLSKRIVIKYLLLKKNEALPLTVLVKGKIIYKCIKIYSDAVSLQALGVMQSSKCSILFICDKQKHNHHSTSSRISQSVISVYSSSQWMCQNDPSYVGFVTLNQILHEIADYRTQTLKTLHRKLSHQPQEQLQI